MFLISSENVKNISNTVNETKVREGGKKMYLLHEMNVGKKRFETKVR